MLGRARVILSPIWQGGGQWDWAPAGGGAFGFGDPEVHQEGKSTTGKEGSHLAAWEGEMVGVTLLTD